MPFEKSSSALEPQRLGGREWERPIRVLELRSVRGTGGGPEKTILLGAARADHDRVAVTVCYIRDLRDEIFGIDERAARMNVDYVELTERHSFDPAVWPALRRLVRERRIDIVHSHEHKTDLLALLLAKAEGVIPLATAHGWSGTSPRERAYYFFDRRLLARYPIVIAVSDPIRQTIISHGALPSQVRRIHNGIDHEYFRRQPGDRDRIRGELGLAKEAVVIGALGRLEPIKGFDLLIEATARLCMDTPATVLIAGDGSCRQALERQMDRLGLGRQVRMLGHREDIRDLHQALDVYVQSSRSEGIPNAILEAMALETPVVATDVGGTRELIEHDVHGVIVPANDPDALARAIERIIAEPTLARRCAAAARARVEHAFSFDRRTRAVEDIYEELMDRYGRIPREVEGSQS